MFSFSLALPSVLLVQLFSSCLLANCLLLFSATKFLNPLLSYLYATILHKVLQFSHLQLVIVTVSPHFLHHQDEVLHEECIFYLLGRIVLDFNVQVVCLLHLHQEVFLLYELSLTIQVELCETVSCQQSILCLCECVHKRQVPLIVRL